MAARAAPGPHAGGEVTAREGGYEAAGRAVVTHPRVFLAFLGLAVATPLAVLVGSAVLGLPGRFNDFASYWLAGRLLVQGGDPYDLAALAALGRREHVEFLLGTGYSYPLPFAVAAIPLANLPFELAAWAFSLGSIAAFGLAVATWLVALPFGGLPERAALAFAAGFYPPIAQSAFFGQANLLVVALLAAGLLPLALEAAQPLTSAHPLDSRLDSRSHRAPAIGPALIAGALLGLAGIVKLVPLTLAVPLAVGRRWAALAGLGGAVAVTLVAATLAFPAARSAGSLVAQLFSPDGFWTNQSVNGLASRLVEPSARTVPLAPGFVAAGTLVAILTCALGAVLAYEIWRARAALTRPAPFALAVGAVLVAAVAGAPKDSFWNHSQALVGAGLLVAATVSTGGVRLARRSAVLAAAWYLAAVAQNVLDQSHGSVSLALGPLGSVVSSTALLGLLSLVAALTIEMRRAAAAAVRGATDEAQGSTSASALPPVGTVESGSRQ